MEYTILNKHNVLDYIQSIDEIQEYFGSDDLFIDEIGDGNLNYVFIIKSLKNASKALILKQAVPYLRCAGEDYPLGRERMTYEIRALQTFYAISNMHVPKIYHANEAMSCVIMHYLDAHIIMRKGMMNKIIYPSFAEHISTYLAQNLFRTSSLYLSSQDKRELIDKFNLNTQLCKLTEDFVFTFAFMEHETNDAYATNHKLAKRLYEDSAFKRAVLELKYKFMTQTDALIHGDLHTGSIMLNEKETYVIDPEFAFVGPFGFDIGALIGNLIMSYVSHTVLKSGNEYKEWILKTIEEIFIKFEQKFLILWESVEESALVTNGFLHEYDLVEYKEKFMIKIFQDSLGFAGCKMARRMFGIAGVADIREIEDKKTKDAAIEMTLEIAKVLVKKRTEMTKVGTVIHLIKEKTK